MDCFDPPFFILKDNEMATPWEQAEDFVASNWKKFKQQTRNAEPTRPQDRLDSITQGWVGGEMLDRIGVPAWVFIYSPTSVNKLFEWAGNVGAADLGRGVLGYTKLVTVKSNSGMLFLGAWKNRRLEIPVVVVVQQRGLFIFDNPNGQHRLLTEELWKEYTFAEQMP